MTATELASDRAKLAVDYIKSGCAGIGAVYDPGDIRAYVCDTAAEIAVALPSTALPERYIEHVAYAMNQFARNEPFSPPVAVASVYLATRFEYYFRVLSGRLNGDGTWVSSTDQNEAQKGIKDQRLGKKCISSVSLAYKIMKLNTSSPLAQHCSALDGALYPTPAGTCMGDAILDLGDRIEFGRNAVGHGHWGDMSRESMFYSLMTALVFYSRE